MSHPLLSGKAGETHLLLGNEAIVRGAVEAGIHVISCYPGTPSSEVPDTLFRISPDADYYFEYSVNEKVALEVAGGSTLAGALTMCTMKHVGVNVAADPLMTLCYTGAPGGLVLLSADDPGCHSSQNEQDNRIYARIAGMPVFEPATAQEAKDMTREALLLSKKLQMPVLLRTTTRVNHLRGPVVFGDVVKPAPIPEFVKAPNKYVPIPAFSRPMHLNLMERMDSFAQETATTKYNTVVGSAKTGVLATGIARAYLEDALDNTGYADKLAVMELGVTYPLPDNLILDFINKLDTLLVLEELEPVLENEIRALAQKHGVEIKIFGKDVMPRNGEFDVVMVQKALANVLGETPVVPESCAACANLPMRPPNLCAGCPHRAAYFAVRQVFGDNAVYSSDIGCYTLGILPPLSAADFLLCMGSSVSAGSGFSKASGKPVVAFIGDSTFFHSGITGLVNAVFNDHDLILVVLDNHTTAMTGHQPNPGVELTILGDNEKRINLETICKGCGVEDVVTINPLNYKKTVDTLEEMKEKKGVRVIIAREPCPLHSKRLLKKRPTQVAYVTEDYDMSEGVIEKLACPAFRVNDGRFEIDELQCSGCMLCLQISKNIKARKRGA